MNRPRSVPFWHLALTWLLIALMAEPHHRVLGQETSPYVRALEVLIAQVAPPSSQAEAPIASPPPADTNLVVGLTRTPITLPNGHSLLALSFACESNYNYVVEYRDDLAPGFAGGWQALTDAPHNSGLVFTENVATNRFFRVRRLDGPRSGLFARLAHDTGRSDRDAITTDPAITGGGVDPQQLQSLWVRCRADGAFIDVRTEVDGQGNFVLNRQRLAGIQGTPLVDGPCTVQFRAVSASLAAAAGATGGQTNDFTLTFLLDTTPPATYVAARPPLFLQTNAARFEFRGADILTAATELTYQLRLDNRRWTNETGRVDLTNLAEGPHILEARAVDAAGNVDPTPVRVIFSVDTQSPDTFLTRTPPVLTRETSARFEFFAVKSNAVHCELFHCRLIASNSLALPRFAELTNWQECTSPVLYTNLLEGWHTFEVRGIDAAGNVDPTPATFTWLIDLSVPLTLRLHPDFDTPPTNDLRTTLSAVTLIGQTEPGLLVSLTNTTSSPGSEGGRFLGTTLADATGLYAFTNVALVPSTNYFLAATMDALQNYATARLAVELLVETNRCPFEPTKEWRITISPASLPDSQPAARDPQSAIARPQLPPRSSKSEAQSPKPATFDLHSPALNPQPAGAIRQPVPIPQPATLNPLALVRPPGPQGPEQGRVEFDPVACAFTLTEGDSFLVTLSKNIVIPVEPSTLTITYSQLTFDPSTLNSIRDAFEVALVDGAGRPLTYTIQGAAGVLPASQTTPLSLPPSPDALFNHSDGHAPFVAPGAALTSQPSTPQRSTLAIDLRHLAPGTTARLILRLVNNDQDSATTVRITDFRLKPFDATLNFGGSPPAAFSLLQSPSVGTAVTTGETQDCPPVRLGFTPAPRSGAAVIPALNSRPCALPRISSKVLAGPITNDVNRHVYYLLKTDFWWSESEAEAVRLGGHLVTINDESENRFVTDTFGPIAEAASSGVGGKVSLWIGLSDALNEGVWIWSSGEPVTYTRWAPGEPAGNSADEDYAGIATRVDGWPRGVWHDILSDRRSDDIVFGVVEVDPVAYCLAQSGGPQLPTLSIESPVDNRQLPVGTTLLSGSAIASVASLAAPSFVTNGLEVYFAEDVSIVPPDGPNDVPRQAIPNTLLARTAFLSRLRTPQTETFESFASGSRPATLNFGDVIGTISGPVSVGEELDASGTGEGGFPLSGTHYVGLGGSQGSSLFFRLDFSRPQSVFGVFGTDVELNRFELILIETNGTRRTAPANVTVPQGSGGGFYFGIIDPLHPFSAVEFHNIGGASDGYCFDDMTVAGPEDFVRIGTNNSIAFNSIAFVTVNGVPVDALDAAGNFFSAIDVRPGQNVFEVVATDAFNQSTTNTITVFGTTCPQNFASLGEVSASVLPEYGRTSFNEWTKVLYADLALRNTGTYPIRAPFYVGVTRISDPTVRLLAPDGMTADGIPYYDYTATLTTGLLNTGSLSAPRALAFHNPNHVQFTYDLVVLGQLNQAPYFTTAPVLEAIVGRPYTYTFHATDPDGDPLIYSLLTSPTGMALNSQLSTLNFQPSTNQIGTHDIRLRADDGKGGLAEQHYLLNVIDPPSNRPPYFVSTPVTVARVFTGEVVRAASSIFLTGHDADFHAVSSGGENPVGARNINRAAISFITDTNYNQFSAAGIRKFLFVESKGDVPSGHRRGVEGIVASGYVLGIDFDHHDYTTLSNALNQLGQNYSAIVIASDYGGILRQEELDILNARSVDIIAFLNEGGGLYAIAESNNGSQLTPRGGRFQYLPFVVSSTPLDQTEVGNTVTPFGSSLGLASSDVNGNFSHNVFDTPGGLNVVDIDAAGRILSLAAHGEVRPSGVIREGVYAYDADAVDPDADPLTYSLVVAPTNMTVNPRTGLIIWAPTADEIGTHDVTVQVQDGRGGTNFQSYRVCVLPAEGNRAPIITSCPITNIVAGQPFSYDTAAVDPDGDTLTYALVGGPAGMTIDSHTGVLNWSGTKAAYTNVFFADFSSEVPNEFSGITNTEPVQGYATLGTGTNVFSGLFLRNETGFIAGESRASSTILTLSNLPPHTTVRLGFLLAIIDSWDGNLGDFPGPDFFNVIVDGTTIFSETFENAFGQTMQGYTPPLGVQLAGNTDLGLTPGLGYYRDAAYDMGLDPQFQAIPHSANNLVIEWYAGGGGWQAGDDESWALDNVAISIDTIPRGPFPITVRASDGRGGVDVQDFVLNILAPGGAEVRGVVYRDLNRNGIRNFSDCLAPSTITNAGGQSAPNSLWLGNDEGNVPVFNVDTNGAILRSIPALPNTGLAIDPVRNMLFLAVNQGPIQTRDLESLAVSGTILQSPASPYGEDMAFDGTYLYRVDYTLGGVYRIDPATGSATLFISGLSEPIGVAWDGSHLWVSEENTARVLRFTSAGVPTGQSFVFREGRPLGLAFDCTDGALWIGSCPRVYHVSTNGTVLHSFVNPHGRCVDGLEYQGSPPTPIEPGLSNWIVYADLNLNAHRDSCEPFSVTDIGGAYVLANLTAGNHTIRVERQPDWVLTAPSNRFHQVTLTNGQVLAGLDFGVYHPTNSALNASPVFVTTPPSAPLPANGTWLYSSGADDVDGDPLTFDLVARPEGMLVETNTGVVAWRPLLAQLGVHDVILRVQDGRGGVALQSWQITVVPSNSAPVFTTVPRGPAVVGLPWQYVIRAQDAEGQALTFQLAANAPPGIALTPALSHPMGEGGTSSAVLIWTLALMNLGTNRIEIIVHDEAGAEARQTFGLEVVASAPNRAPQFITAPRTQTRVNTPYAYVAKAIDADGDPLAFTLVSGPSGLHLTPALSPSGEGVFQWTPQALGVFPVVLTVSDGRAGGVVTQAFAITVSSTLSNSPPLIASQPSRNATAGQPYEYNPAAIDPDDDPVTWRLVNGPVGMSLDSTTGALRWTPTLDQLGTNIVTLEVQDVLLATDLQTWAIDVGCVNRPPQITSVPPTTAQTGEPYLYALRAEDPDGDALTFSFADTNAFPVPLGMTLSNLPSPALAGTLSHPMGEGRGEGGSGLGGALIRWTPTTNQVGTYAIRVRVTDGRGGNDIQSYNLYVADLRANKAPIIVSTPPRGATVGRPYSYTLRATDSDGDTLTLSSLVALPTGASFTPSPGGEGRGEGVLSWTPTSTQQGAFEFILSARDPAGASAAQRFFITVRSNLPPVITSTSRTNAVPGVTYRYDVSAFDPDGDALSYVLNNAPAGMTIDSLGRIAWTSAPTDVGGYTITVSASDGFGGVASQTFPLTVAADTEPPQVALALVQGLVNPDNGQWAGNLGDTIRVRVDASDNVGVASRALYRGTNAISLDASYTASILIDRGGLFNFTGVAVDFAGNSNSTSRSILFRDPNATSHIFVQIHTPTNDAIITQPVNVVATITNDTDLISYSWGYALVSDINPNGVSITDPAFTVVGTTNLPPGTRSLANLVVGRFDPTLLNNDTYVIAVAGSDANGNTWTEPVVVSVQGNLKFGEFRLEFTDLAIPVAGIPIQVTRVYDSRNARRVGDFGHGWCLGVQDAFIRESVPEGRSFRPNTRVNLTGPDGRRLGYTFAPTVMNASFFGALFRPKFQADAGVYEKLEVPDETFSFEGAGIIGGILEALGPYNPSTYFLTTRYGTRYTYEQSSGLQNVTDLNGNRLVYTRDGIFHYSAGSVTSDQSVRFVRDAQGRIAQIIDPNGKAIRYTYDSRGDLASFADLATNVTSYRYETRPAHFLTNIIDFLGRNALRAEFEPGGRLAAIYDAQGNPLRQAFDLDSKTATFTDGNGNTILSAFDSNGNETVRGILGVTTNYFAYDANNNLLASTNGRGFATNYTYDARGNVTSIRDSLGNRTAVAYNDQNKPTSVTNPLGQTLNLRYDAGGKPLEVVHFDGRRTVATRNLQGLITTLFDGPGGRTEFEYSSTCPCGRPTKVINPDGSFRRLEYNALGQVTREINENGDETVSSFDANGRLLWMQDAQSNRTSFEYRGPLLVSMTDALGRMTRYEYDALNRTNAIINAQGGVVRFEYDLNGNRTKVIDPVTNVTTFVYDAGNRLTQQIDPLGHTNFFAYDAAGNRTDAIDRNGRKRTFAYDAANRMTNELWWEGTNVVRSIVFGFNNAGAQTLAADHSARYEYHYNGLNRLERLHARSPGVPDFTLDYTYTPLGQVESVTDNWDVRVGSSYDSRGRLVSRAWQGPGISPARVDFTYDVSGNRVRTDRFADLAGTNRIGFTTNAYNRAGIVTNITHLGPASEVLAKYDYHFDVAYQIRNWSINNQLSTFNYDQTGQLTNALNTAQPNENFRFDANGNRVGAQSSGQYVVGGNNQILSDGTNRYAYDAEGNMTSRSNTVTGVLTTYQWDHRNRLASVLDRNPGGVVTQTVAFVYDAVNHRISKSVNNKITRFLYNHNDSWADLDASNSVVMRHFRGGGIDELVARYHPDEGINWYLTDRIGTVREITSESGNVVASVDYGGFGKLLIHADSRVVDRFLFTGREFDFETGLFYYRARYYSPDLGRFMSQDSFGFGANDFNLYRYVNNSPLNGRDPTGNISLIGYINIALVVVLVTGAALVSCRDEGLNAGAGQPCQFGGIGDFKRHCTWLCCSGRRSLLPAVVWILGGIAFELTYEFRENFLEGGWRRNLPFDVFCSDFAGAFIAAFMLWDSCPEACDWLASKYKWCFYCK